MALRGCDEVKIREEPEAIKILHQRNLLIATEKKLEKIKEVATKKRYRDILKILKGE